MTFKAFFLMARRLAKIPSGFKGGFIVVGINCCMPNTLNIGHVLEDFIIISTGKIRKIVSPVLAQNRFNYMCIGFTVPLTLVQKSDNILSNF